jgi:hypothetical protein
MIDSCDVHIHTSPMWTIKRLRVVLGVVHLLRELGSTVRCMTGAQDTVPYLLLLSPVRHQQSHVQCPPEVIVKKSALQTYIAMDELES